jgi:hypothetical protein
MSPRKKKPATVDFKSDNSPEKWERLEKLWEKLWASKGISPDQLLKELSKGPAHEETQNLLRRLSYPTSLFQAEREQHENWQEQLRQLRQLRVDIERTRKPRAKKSRTTKSPPDKPPRLDYDWKRLWHDGHWDDLSDPEANLFKALFDAKGAWVNLSFFNFDAAKVKFRMKKCLKDLIQSDNRKGYRIPRLLSE